MSAAAPAAPLKRQTSFVSVMNGKRKYNHHRIKATKLCSPTPMSFVPPDLTIKIKYLIHSSFYGSDCPSVLQIPK